MEKGEFLKEIVVRVPAVIEGFIPSQANSQTISVPLLEVEELKVFPGEQVQAGHLLGYLSNHQNLYIEGRGPVSRRVRSQSGIGLSVVYVEFDWGSDIRVARQVVQERLTTTQGSMPPGVRPQMAPISSIMGQIMHIGMYLRKGPQGGELTPISKTSYFAELVHDPRTGQLSLSVWNAKDRRATEPWEPLPSDGGRSL